MFVVTTLVAPFALGLLLFSKWIFRDVEVRWGIGFASQVAFALVLAVAFQTHIAVLGEVSGVLRKDVRDRIWTWDLTCWIILLEVILPFLMLCAFFVKRRQIPVVFRVVFVFAGQVVWLLAINWGQTPSLQLEKEAERIGMIGLACVAILSGWGSVHGPYSYGPWFIKRYDDDEIAHVEEKLWSVMEMRSSLKRREAMLLYRQRAESSGVVSPRSHSSTSGQGLLRGLWNRQWTRDDATARSIELALSSDRAEGESLTLLSTELFLELSEMKRARQQTLFRKTLLGQVYTVLGYTFAVYCVLKMIVAAYGIVYPKRFDDPDLITNVLSFVLLFARTRMEANFLAETISFIMVGVLVFNSFRGLLVTLGRIFHQVGPRDASLVALLLTEIMGQYLLSSIIMMDMNLPVQYRSAIFLKKFEFFRVWSDALFLISGFASFLLLYAQDKAQGSRTEFYHSMVHDKMM